MAEMPSGLHQLPPKSKIERDPGLENPIILVEFGARNNMRKVAKFQKV